MGGHYPIALSVLNLVLLVSSTACLYLSSIMINIYLLPYLEVINSHFATVPYLILTIGFLLLVFSMFGMVAAGTGSRPALIIYAVVMSIAVVIEAASIFVSMVSMVFSSPGTSKIPPEFRQAALEGRGVERLEVVAE